MNNFSDVLREALRQWNDFIDDRQDCTIEDFVDFCIEINNNMNLVEV